MDDDAVDDPLNEIAAALDVRPSPELVVRVRARVARDQERASGRGYWMAVSAALAAGIVVLAGSVWLVPRTRRPVAVPSAVVAAPAEHPLAGAGAFLAETGRQVRVRSARQRPPAGLLRTNRLSGPEVLVPRDQALAVRSVLLALRQHWPMAPQASKWSGTLSEPAEMEIPMIEIVPIAIEPLTVLSVDENGGIK
jgi:hypothetical protein